MAPPMSTKDALAAFAFGAAVCILVLGMLSSALHVRPETYWHKQIIQHGAGRYNPTTAQFEWLTVDTGRAQ